MAVRKPKPADGNWPHEGKTFNKQKSGWCITDDHKNCNVSFISSLTRATYVCPCECHTKQPKKSKTPRKATRRSAGS